MDMVWSVNYGDGFKSVTIPHSWHLEMPVSWEGPAIYRCQTTVPDDQGHLIFNGVSYMAEVSINGEVLETHFGIWDAFSVDLSRWKGTEVTIYVKVVKNGGATFPVKEVASGFLPYVYHTFGGIFRSVEFSSQPVEAYTHRGEVRVSVNDGRTYVNGSPFYCRGILTWGWYPQFPSPNPDLSTICSELDQIESMGFNVVKFCLWLPPHEYLVEMERRGLLAWIELPIWLPATDKLSLERLRTEALRIVEQYRKHPNIFAWTVGCELSEGISPEWRRDLVQAVHELTQHPLVKDNSGGAEMYGGHPHEFGTFEDFHPYCDPMFFSSVLFCLSRGPRKKTPTFLGEFNDYDIFRPLHHMVDSPPYWASSNIELNDKGVRWQYDLPEILQKCKDSDLAKWLGVRCETLLKSSYHQAIWMRQNAFDATRLQSDIDGWVLTGHRHTPISSSGVVDDNGELVFPVDVVRNWTSDQAIMLFPRRTPPWVDGGNRPGWEHPTVRFSGPSLFQVAVHSTLAARDRLRWEIVGIAQGECEQTVINPLETRSVGFFIEDLAAGEYKLNLEWGQAQRSFDLKIVERLPDFDIRVIHRGSEIPAPFFRECCWSFEHPIWEEHGWGDDFDRLSLVAGDSVLDPEWLDEFAPGWEPVLVRLDTRTFDRKPVVAMSNGKVWASLLKERGIGYQPVLPEKNPAAHDLLRLVKELN